MSGYTIRVLVEVFDAGKKWIGRTGRDLKMPFIPFPGMSVVLGVNGKLVDFPIMRISWCENDPAVGARNANFPGITVIYSTMEENYHCSFDDFKKDSNWW